jgi:hypothetical protein
MNSTPNPTPSDPTSNPGNPDDILVARADQRLTHAYEQIARADEQLARLTEQLSKLEQGAARPAALAPPPRPASSSPLLRGFVGLVLAGGIGAAAYASQSPYGDAARQTIAQWAPYLVSPSSPWLTKSANAAQPGPPGVQLASAEANAAQPAPAAQGSAQGSVQDSAQDVASPPVPAAPDLAQLLQNMAHDLSTVEQGIEELKASQERMAADNARAIEELKAGQDQMARLAARPPEPEHRARTPVPPSGPVANAAPRPQPKPPAQARAHTQPVPLQPREQ